MIDELYIEGRELLLLILPLGFLCLLLQLVPILLLRMISSYCGGDRDQIL